MEYGRFSPENEKSGVNPEKPENQPIEAPATGRIEMGPDEELRPEKKKRLKIAELFELLKRLKLKKLLASLLAR